MSLTTATPHSPAQPLPLRRALGDVMKFEILINENAKVWIFHDQPLPYRLAWVEFNPLTGMIELMPHDMRHGILYADAPAALHARLRTSTLAYIYQTDGDKVLGFQKAPIQITRLAKTGNA
jgi:hypothetical protein